MQIQGRIHALRIEPQLHVIIPIAPDPLRGSVDDHVLHRPQMRIAAQDQRCRRAGERRLELQQIDRQLRDVDARDGGGAAARIGRCFRKTLHIHGRRMQRLDLQTARQQRRRRPVERHPLGGQPDPAIIAELQPLDSQ